MKREGHGAKPAAVPPGRQVAGNGGARADRPLNTGMRSHQVSDRILRSTVRAAAAVLLVLTVPRIVAGQTSGSTTPRTTAAGVYTDEQADRGRDTYAMQCKSCHTPASHTGVTFATWWDRKPLSDLYQFVTTRMPKNEPGSLLPDEYVDVIAYLLKLNELPSGSEPLPADSVALRKIRIEVGKK